MRIQHPRRVVAALSLALSSLAGCSSSSSTSTGTSPEGGVAAANAMIGMACTPSQETDPDFTGADVQQVTLDTGGAQCGFGGACLSDHFRGRVSCPYGQDANGVGPNGTAGCKTPDTSTPILQKLVAAQCTDRLAASTVFCSCRCANVAGRTDDGASYCTCPGSMTCAPTIASIGSANDTLSGSYCVKPNLAYDMMTACAVSCDPKTNPCP